MSRARPASAIVLALACAWSAGCGGAPMQGSPARAPASESASPAVRPAPDGAAAAESPAPAPADAARGLGDRTARATGDFDRAARLVETGSSDCRQACRALASMERACGELCALDDDATCRGDKERVREARARVRSSCGSCPDGTSVEPDAPLPGAR